MQPLTKAAKLLLRFSQQKGPQDLKKIITTTDDLQPTIRKFNNVDQQKEVPSKIEFKKKDNELRQGFKPTSKPQEKQFQQNVQRQKQISENIDSPQYTQNRYQEQQQNNQFKQQNKYDHRQNKSFENRNNQSGFKESLNKNTYKDQRFQEKKISQQQPNTNKKIEDKDLLQEFYLQNEKQEKYDSIQVENIGKEKIIFEDFGFTSDGTPISINDLNKEEQESYKQIKEQMEAQFKSFQKQKEPPSEKFEVTDEKIKEVEEEAFLKLKQFEKKFNILTPEEQAQQEDEEDLLLAQQNQHKGYLIQEVYENNQKPIYLPQEVIETLKRYERGDPNDLQGGQYLEKYLKQAQMLTKDIHISGDIAQLQHYAGSGQFNKVHEFIEQQQNLTQELLVAYIDIIDNYQNVENYHAFQNVLNKNQKLFSRLDQSYFVQIYEMIFRSKLAKQEMIDVLIWYFKYMKQLKYANIGNLNLILFENVIDAGIYKLNPQIFEKLIYVFNQYLSEYKEAQRGKQLTGFPSLRVLLNIAVDQTIKDLNKECLKFIQILRQLQQLSQDFIDLSDLARLIKFFAGKTHKLEYIIEIYEQINDKRFIFQLDVIVTQFLREGGIIKCTENLEEYYKTVDVQNVRKLEIICLFAHKLKNYGIIADIYFKQQNSAKYSKSLSSYIFQICINTVLEQETSSNTSNAVMSLVNEANSKDVPLNDIFVTMNNMKAQIKDGKYQTAFLLFEKRIIAKTILQFQSKKVLRFLLKYLLNQYPEQFKPSVYFKLSEYAYTFVEQLNERQLLQLFLDEKYDNQIFEAIIEEQSIFQFQTKERKRFIYENIRNELLNGDYNYQKLIGCEENDDLLLEREIFMNYEYYLEQERAKILNGRKQVRIANIFSQIDPNFFEKKNEEEIYKELFATFTQEELEQNLMDNDTIEFPELEQVKKFQEFIRPHILKTLPIDLNFDLDLERDISPQLRQQNETEKGSDVTFTKEELEEMKSEISYIDYENKLFDDKDAQKQFIRENIKWEQDERNMNDAVDFKTEIDMPKDIVIMSTSVEEDTIKEVIREYDENDDDKLKFNPKQMFFFGKLENIEFWQMKHVYYCPYQYNDHYIFTDPNEFQNEIWDLVAWGIHNQEPMAIKLGEYYSNISGQRIPEYLNQAIGEFYKYQVGHKYSKLRQKWIEALKIVGKVDYNKVYHKTAENAFLTPQDREVAQWLDTQSIYKPHMRAVMWKDFNPNKYVRYGVTNLDLL